MQATALIFYIAFRGEQTAGSHALAHRTFTSAHSCGSAVTFRSERKYHYHFLAADFSFESLVPYLPRLRERFGLIVLVHYVILASNVLKWGYTDNS